MIFQEQGMTAATLSLAVWFLFQTIGSIFYDREHRDKLIKNYMNQIASLSLFPETNPNMIFRLNLEGEVLYANPAARKKLSEIDPGSNKFHQLLPHNLRDTIQTC